MQSMIASQQQLLKRKPNDFINFSSSPNFKLEEIPTNSIDKTLNEVLNENENSENNISENKNASESAQEKPNLNKINKKSSSWFSLLPTYKTRSEEFKRYFGHIVPSDERFIADYSCAYQRKILAQGRMYISLNYICFYANILSWETVLAIKYKDIKKIYKTNTALIFPNAIEVLTTSGEKHFFTSFVAREKAFILISKIWQNCSLETNDCLVRKSNKKSLKSNINQNLIWEWIHDAYGENLGFTSDEENYQKSITDNLSIFNSTTDTSESESEYFLDSDLILNNINNQKEFDFEKEKLKMSSNYLNNKPFCCCCEQHNGEEVFSQNFAMTVDQLFFLAFDDSPFYRMVQKQRKATDMNITKWEDVENIESNIVSKNNEVVLIKKKRNLQFDLHLDHALAKLVSVKEEQTLNEKSVPGCYYMISSKCENSNVPFSDSFEVYTQWCLTRGSSSKECSLLVHTKIDFIKSGFGLSLMKGTIEKSSVKGLKDYCEFLSQQLHDWCKQKSLERRKNLNFQKFKLEYNSSNEDNVEDNDIEKDVDSDEVFDLSRSTFKEESNLIQKNRKLYEIKRKKMKPSNMKCVKNVTSCNNYLSLKNNELILFVIFIILFLIFILIIFLFKRLLQLENLIKNYEENLISLERFFRIFSRFNKNNKTNLSDFNLEEIWQNLINETKRTMSSIKTINSKGFSNSLNDDL